MTRSHVSLGVLIRLLVPVYRLRALDECIRIQARCALSSFDEWAKVPGISPLACKAAALVLHDRLICNQG